MDRRREKYGKNREYRKSVRLGRAIIAVGILALACGFLLFRLRGGAQIKPSEEQDFLILPEEQIILYRQDDPRWGRESLGDSRYTMASSGCLVSSIASAVSMESGEERTPGALNAEFCAGDVYDAEGNLQWERLAELHRYQAEVYQEVSADIIDACLSAGKYPVVRVRMYALGNIHYVLIVGVRDGEYLCMDPLQDKLTKLSSYGNRVYAVRCVSRG